MALFPSPPVIGLEDGFTDANDIFDLVEFGTRLLNLVSVAADDALTLVLDGDWGGGKSTFIRQWAGQLRQNGIPVVEFDAFENDYHEDGFTALAGAILTATPKPDLPLTQECMAAAKAAGKVLMKRLPSLAFKLFSLGAIEAEDSGKLVSDVAKAVADAGSAITDDLISERLEHYAEQKGSLEKFRSTLQALAAELGKSSAEGERNRPLVVIVDELDRCRPDFALSLLERIKHLYAVPGVVFVLVSNLKQLAAAVKGAYGADTDAERYLQKFYQLRAHLPLTSPRIQEGKRRRYVVHLWQMMRIAHQDTAIDADVKFYIGELVEVRQLQLRDIERVVSHAALAFTSRAGGRGDYFAPLISGLAVLRHDSPKLFDTARRNKLTWKDAFDYFRLDQWEDSNSSLYFLNSWRIATDASLSEEQIRNVMQNNRIVPANRLGFPAAYARIIDDFTVS